MAEAGPSAAQLVAGRLAGSGLAGQAADLVRAALNGAWPQTGPAAGAEPGAGAERGAGAEPGAGPPVYLREIRAGGARVSLPAGPGLTVVTGPQWAGLAEGVELALAAAAEPGRAEGMELGPGGGWATPIAVELDGEVRPAALTRYRPVLSRADLAALACGTPGQRYDALRTVLGLGEIVAAERALEQDRRRAGAAAARARQMRPGLLGRLAGCADDRAGAAAAILSREPADLMALARLAVSAAGPTGGPADLWRQLAAARLPGTEVARRAAQRLAQAAERATALPGTPADDARQLAELVRAGVEHARAHPGRPCPLCRGRVLSPGWTERAGAAGGRLRRLAAEADAIAGEVEAAAAALRTLVPRLPAVIEGAPVPLDLGLDLTAARTAWRQWTQLAAGDGVDLVTGVNGVAGAAEVERRYAALSDAVASLATRAADRLRAREDTWRPAGIALAAWIQAAAEAGRAGDRAQALGQAGRWLRGAGQEITAQRLLDMGLDQGLDRVLRGLSPAERLELGMDVFVARAGAGSGPFGFMVVDQPEQADAGRLTGRLEQAARRVRVIVSR
jgi:hypothetical protein